MRDTIRPGRGGPGRRAGALAFAVAVVLGMVLAPQALSATITIPAEADTFVSEGTPTTSYGTAPSFDVYGGVSSYGCGTGRSMGLLRFDLSTIPAGVVVTGATLTLTSFTGFAYNGDPEHHAIYLADDSWTETGATWSERPADGLVLGTPYQLNGQPFSTSPDNLGATSAGDDKFCDGNLDQDRAFASGNLTSKVSSELASDPAKKLSIELLGIACGTPFTTLCVNSGGNPTGFSEQSYFLRYRSREAATGIFTAPRLSITYTLPGSIVGSTDPFVPAVRDVDLTAAGTEDWAVWGFATSGTSTSLAPDVRKSGGSAISTLTNIDPDPSIGLRGLGQFAGTADAPPFVFDWTNGTGPGSAANAPTGLQHNGGPQLVSTVNHGFGFSVPADTTTRTLKVYVATNRAAGQLTATLSDGSAPAYVNTLPAASDVHASVYTVTYAAGSSGQTLHVDWIETIDTCGASYCDNAAIYGVALSGPAQPPPVATNVDLTAGSPSAQAGAARVELDAVPPEALLGGTSGTSAAPLNSIPINSIPIGSIPIGSIPIGSIPIGSIGLGTALPFLADVALSTIPLTPPLSWDAILTGTSLANLSLQQVTLAQVLGNTAAAGNLASVPIGSIQLQRSPIGSIPIGSIPIGSIPIGSIAVPQNPDAPATSDIPTRWCQWLSGPPINCVGNGGTIAGSTIISLALQGAPIGSIPIGSIPIGSIPIGSIPIGSIPLGSIPIGSITVQRLSIAFSPIGSIPIGSIPIGSIPIGSIPIGSIPIGSIDLQSSPIGSIPIGSIAQPNSVFIAPPVGPLLRNVPAGQFVPGLTFEALLRASAPGAWNAITFTDLILHTNPAVLHGYTVAQLVNSLPPGGDTTYADVLALLIQESDLGWERLDLPSTDLQTVATEGGSVAYHASFALQSATGPVPTQVDIVLPSGFRYDPDSARWSRGGIDQGVLTPTELTSGTLRFTVPTTVDATYAIDLTVHPGITLGPQSAGLEVTPQPGAGAKVADPTPPIVNVTDTFEANGTPAQGKLLSTDSLYLSYLPGGADIDLYRFTVPAAGTRTTFRLSHLPVDYDLVVYGPNGQQLVTPTAGTPPVDGEPLADGGYAATHATDPLAPQTLDDVTLLTLPVLGVSTQRGTEDDAVVVVSDGTPGEYVVQVSGFNGASSDQPYMLRASSQAGTAPVCSTPRFGGVPAGSSGIPAASTLTTIGPGTGGVTTLFVVNDQQLIRTYPGSVTTTTSGAYALARLNTRLTGLATAGYRSAILHVDNSPAVRTAYDAWNGCPADPAKANAVVAGITAQVKTLRASNPTLAFVVLVGGDDIVPFARIADLTTISNENGYAETFPGSSALGGALGQAQMLSDDVYGTAAPVPFLGHQLYVPELSVGRLVEKPFDIAAQLDRFTAAPTPGRLHPTRALTTGYDFLSDGAAQVSTALGAFAPGVANQLQNTNTWTQTFLTGAIGGGLAPGVVSLNGHADHNQFLPPAGTALFTTANARDAVAASLTFGGRIVFSMGCHAGLNVSDFFVPANHDDWAQAFGEEGSAVFVGNTGFGYGDSALVSYSEDLNRRFAASFAGGAMTVGQALSVAKNEYRSELGGIIGPYDEKAMAEMTLYGLPMYRIGDSTAAPASATSGTGSQVLAVPPPSAFETLALPAASFPIDGPTGLHVESLVADRSFTGQDHPTAAGTYYTGSQGHIIEHLRPIEPKAVAPITIENAHGALITALTSNDVGNGSFNPLYARPIVDQAANEPEISFDSAAFPSKLQGVSTATRLGTRVQRLVLAQGQFFSGSDTDGAGLGTQRLFTHIGAQVYSSTSTDFDPPVFSSLDAQKVSPTQIAFAVTVTDSTPSGPGVVKQVLVGYRDGAGWHFVPLAPVAGNPARWTGGASLTGATFEYFVQAVDAGGNVGVSTNKGRYYEAAAPPQQSPTLAIVPAGTTTAGWFTSPVGVTVQLGGVPAPTDGSVTVSVDSGAPAAYTGPVQVTGDGPHTVTAQRGTDATTLPILIDTTKPVIAVVYSAPTASVPRSSALSVTVTCADFASLLAPAPNGCSATLTKPDSTTTTVPTGVPATLPTAVQGTYTLNVTSKDNAGNVQTSTTSYTVGAPTGVAGQILFSRGGDIYSIKPDGTGLRQITSGAPVDEQPTKTPAGDRIVFARGPAGSRQLFSVDPDGLNLVQLTTSGDNTAPGFSPAGTKIAFQSTRPVSKGIDVWVGDWTATPVPALGSFVDLSNANGNDTTPSWSPTATGKIAFASDRNNGQNEIFVMSAANGSGQTRFTNDPRTDQQPAWAPSPTPLIAFSSDRAGGVGGFDIHIMGSANGNAQIRLGPIPGADTEPYWLDQIRLVFAGASFGGGGLVILPSTQILPQRIPNTLPGDKNPG